VTAQPFQGREVVALENLRPRYPPTQVKCFVALGFRQMNGLRAAKFDAIRSMGYSCVSYVAPSNLLPAETAVGQNCFILANQSIDRNVEIDDNVTIWSGCHIGDRSRINSHTWLSSQVCLNGDVIVEERCFLASNCTVGPSVRLGTRTFVGANALITKDTEIGAVHVVAATHAQAVDSERFMHLLRMF
jgi:UDP-3-O-[3-hydroxymyristoyl] glucosamine N-acyltransferase